MSKESKLLKILGVRYLLSQNTAAASIHNIQDKTIAVSDKSNASHLPIDLMRLSRLLADKATSINELKEIIDNFMGLELKMFATNTVFGEGVIHPKVMFIGEAPGKTEDETGRPYCGASGQLLDNMLAAIGLYSQTNAYITNTVFWRPPANRTPTQLEIDTCRPFVEKHIALVQPKVIVLVGATATLSLLGDNSGITKIKQNWHQYTNGYLKEAIPLTALFHPAYLLRQPMQKKATWQDLLKIQEFLKK